MRSPLALYPACDDATDIKFKMIEMFNGTACQSYGRLTFIGGRIGHRVNWEYLLTLTQNHRCTWGSVSRNPLEIECQYQWSTYRKSSMASRTVTWPEYLASCECLLRYTCLCVCGAVRCRRILKKPLTWRRKRWQSHRRRDICPAAYSRSVCVCLSLLVMCLL